MMETLDCKSTWFKRTNDLKKKYKRKRCWVQLSERGEPRLNKFNLAIEQPVSKVAMDKLQWMKNKTSLDRCRNNIEQAIKRACIYSNDRGSSLIALVFVGM